MLDLVHPNDHPTVLLIDDDLVSREVLATVLTMGGYPVHTAVDGESSLKLIASSECEPGVILMDAQMPGLSGAALVRELRAASKASIVVISASAPSEELVSATDGVLLKPFTPANLTALLEKRAANGKSGESVSPIKAVVNRETLAQLREMMPAAAVRQIYEAIIGDIERRLAAIHAAIKGNDAAEVRRLGHSIKGGCGMAGATEAARLGALIEEGALEVAGSRGTVNHLDNSAPVLDDLRAAADNLKRMLVDEFPS
jgi:CheY-like chemotaxis protein